MFILKIRKHVRYTLWKIRQTLTESLYPKHPKKAYSKARSNRKGFSLVELAVVLVIVGLLVAGILSGGSLIRSAELRGIISEIEEYQVAVKAFNIQYEGLPGDLKNATSYWIGGVTSNGDGNNVMKGDTLDAAPLEIIRAWQHLSLAKYLPVSYTGTGNTITLRTNAPMSKYLNNTGFSFKNGTTHSWRDQLGNLYKGNFLVYGGARSYHYLEQPATNTEDAFQIDKKIDDGKPNSGGILAGGANCPTAAPGATYNSAIGYNLSRTIELIDCYLFIAIGKRE